MLKVELSEKTIEEAIQRHEDKFEEELKNVDIRAVVLKTKKALIEQTLKNNSSYNMAMDHEIAIRELKRSLSDKEYKIKTLERELKDTKEIFAKAVSLLEEQKKPKTKGFFSGFWEFIKCLMK